MGVLAFKVEADYKEAVECRQECIRLQRSMETLKAAGKEQSREFTDLSDKYYKTATRLSDLASKAAETAYYMGPDFKKKVAESARAVEEYATKLKEAREKLNSLKSSGAGYDAIMSQVEEVRNLSLEYVKASENNKKMLDTARVGGKDISEIIAGVGDNIDNLGDQIGNGSPLDTALKALSGKIGAAFSIVGISAFLKQAYSVRSYFQDIESSMEVFLGSQQEAAKFTKDLQDYAYYNMFEFSDLAAASKQLIAYGNEVNKISGKGGILDQLSNVATATKVPLMELVNSWNKAKSTGMVNGRDVQSWAAKGLVLKDVLKDMGEEVKGNSISFEQLQKAIAHVTSEGEMFGGIMDKMMPNLSSSFGQLQDSLSLMWNDIGKKFQEPMHDAIDFASNLVANYEKVGKVILDLVAVLGSAKAAMVVYNTVTGTSNILKDIQLAKTLSLVGAENMEASALAKATAARAKLNASMLTNPYVLATAAIVGITAALYEMNKAHDTTIMSQKKIDSYVTKAHNGYETEKEDLDEIWTRLRRNQGNQAEYNKAKDDAVKMFGKYHSGLEQELNDVTNLDTAYASLKTSIMEANQQRAYNEGKTKIDETFAKKSENKQDKILKELSRFYEGEELYSKYYELLEDIDSGALYLGKDANGRNTLQDKKYFTFANTEERAKALGDWYLDQNLKLTPEVNEKRGILYTNGSAPRFVTGEGDVTGGLQTAIIELIAINQAKDSALQGLKSAVLGENANTQQITEDISQSLEGLSTEEQLEKLKEYEDLFAGYQKQFEENPSLLSIPVKISVDPMLEPLDLNSRGVQTVIKGIKSQKRILNRQVQNDDEESDKQRQRQYNARRTREQNILNSRRQREDSEYNARQAEINNMADGADKDLAKIRLDFDKQRTQFQRQREDYVRKLNDDARRQWVLGGEDRKEADFGPDPYKLVGDTIVASNAYANSEIAQNAFAWADNLKKQETEAWTAYDSSLEDFFSKYGTKAQQRAALVKSNLEALEQLSESLEKVKKTRKDIGDQMTSTYKGNVDLLNRPQIDASKLAEKGWEDVGEGIATVFSSDYTDIVDKNGKSHRVLITPILPDGRVLSEEELNAYVDEKLRGAEDLLKADSEKIVIALDLDENAGEKLHELQEQYYDESDKKMEQALSRQQELAVKQNRLALAQFDYNALGGNGTREQEINARREVLYAEADLIEDAKQKEIAYAKADLEIAQMRHQEGVGSYEDQIKASNDLYEAEKKVYTLTDDKNKLLVLEKNHIAEIMDLEIKAGGGLTKVFGDVSKYTKSQLDNARKIANEFLKANPNIPVDQYKAILDQINAMDEAEFNKMFDLGSGDPKALVKNELYFKHLAEERKKAEEAGDKERFDKLTDQMEQLQEQITKGYAWFGVDSFLSSLQKASQIMKELGELTEDSGLQQAGDVLGSVTQNLQAAEEGAQAWGGWWGAIIGGVTDLLAQGEEAWAGGEKAAHAYNKAVEKARDNIKNLRIEEQLREDGSSVFGQDGQKQIESINSALNTLEKTSKKAGISVTTYFNKGFLGFIGREERSNSIANIARSIGADLYDEYGNLNADTLKTILNTYDALKTSEREWIEQAIEDSENYKDGMEQLKSILANTFSNTSSMLADATIDGLSRGATIGSDRMKEIMSGTAQDLQKQLVQNIYAKYLDSYSDEALNIMRKGGNERDLVDLYSRMFDNMQTTIDTATQAAMGFQEYAEARGFRMSELANAETGAKAYSTLSETTGSAIEGRLTSLQISSQVKESILNLMNTSLIQMLQAEMSHVNIAQNALDIQAESLVELRLIRQNTSDNLSEVKEIKEIVTNIEKSTRSL